MIKLAEEYSIKTKLIIYADDGFPSQRLLISITLMKCLQTSSIVCRIALIFLEPTFRCINADYFKCIENTILSFFPFALTTPLVIKLLTAWFKRSVLRPILLFILCCHRIYLSSTMAWTFLEKQPKLISTFQTVHIMRLSAKFFFAFPNTLILKEWKLLSLIQPSQFVKLTLPPLNFSIAIIISCFKFSEK